ncbi:MAG TPA: hypothetical protein VK934_05300 [Fimbriimonas sp.]|nr:hypothetical protein [Fimbriimonas sp.]
MSYVADAPMMSHEEMRKAFDGEWVLIVDYDFDLEANELLRGRVIAHSVDRRAVEAVDREFKPRSAAYECFRTPGEGTTLVL